MSERTATSPDVGGHEKLAARLAAILQRLQRGERLVPGLLADEFGVSLRTIQRDLHRRFVNLGLIADGGGYRLPPEALGKLTGAGLERLLDRLGVRDAVGPLDSGRLRALAAEGDTASWLVRQGLPAEDLQSQAPLLAALERAVCEQRVIGFRYRASKATVREDVQPYRLLRHHGIGYLAAVDGGRLKTFALGRMSGLLVGDNRFERQADIVTAVAASEGIWFSTPEAPLQEVVLEVDAAVADAWQRRPLVPRQQEVVSEADASLRVRCLAAHQNEVLPVVRYWLPHVRLVSPASWQSALLDGMRAYLDGAEEG